MQRMNIPGAEGTEAREASRLKPDAADQFQQTRKNMKKHMHFQLNKPESKHARPGPNAVEHSHLAMQLK